MSDRDVITVAVCTFRRDSLEHTLRSIAGQQVPGGKRLKVVVADNDTHQARRSEIENQGADLGLDLTYVAAPACNISIARNACLEACQSEWLAFIDDDEVAEPDWVAQLLSGIECAVAVFGVSRAIYPSSAPAWLAQGDFHSNRMSNYDPPWKGYTSNVLIDMRFVRKHSLRFREALGQTGGEDTIFFREAFMLGARFNYVPQATVTEQVEGQRLTCQWLVRRRFRSGQIHYLVLRDAPHPRVRTMAAAGKFLLLLGASILAGGLTVRGRSLALRALLHLGVVASALGAQPYREYKPPEARA